MRHRPAGAGTAYQEKATGLWVAERTVEGRRFRRKAQTRPLAMSRLDQAISAQDRGPADVTSDTTLAEYLRLWLPGYRDIRPKTRAGYRHAFEAYVIPLIGEVRVSELRTRHVAGVLRHMAEQGLSASTRRNTRNALSSALNAAVLRDEVAETNVAKGIRVPEGENRALNIVVSPAKIKGFLRALEDHPHYHVWALTLYLVRRIGETVALRAGRISPPATARSTVTIPASGAGS
jgi:integrase